MIDLEKHYETNCAAYKLDADRMEKKANLLSRIRLVVFLLIIPLLIFWTKIPLPGLFLLGLIAVFLWLVRLHEEAKEARRVAHWLFKLNEEELLYLREHRFPSQPVNFNLKDHPFANDLDIFGDQSLFHLINRTVTVYGRERLAANLTAAPLDTETILIRQEAIRELAADEKFRHQFLAMGRDEGLQHNDLSEIFSWLEKDEKVQRISWIRWMRYVWPVLSIGTAVLCWNLDRWSFFTPVAIISWGLIAFYRQQTDSMHKAVSGQQKILGRFSGLFGQLADTNFRSPILSVLKNDALAAKKSLKELAAITERFDQRKNIFGNILLNTFGMHDIACMYELTKWKAANKESLRKWIFDIGEAEMLISAATFHFNHPAFCFPVPEKNGLSLSGKEIAHPLISPKHRISNDIEFVAPKKLFFITGSNMSGKSTFLRSLGLNLVLAQAGFPVAAKTFQFTPMKLATSIRISDSLRENTSLFYAELLKLRTVLDELEKGEPCFVLLDEILRGTNSADKYHGAYGFIKKLIRHNGMIVFATHDLKLCELRDELPEITENYRFEGIIEGDQLHFPYKIEKGIVQNRTASFLMKQLRLVD